MVLSAAEAEAAKAALAQIYDPELATDIVSLGLVYSIEEIDGRVVADMTLTSPGCPVAQTLPLQAGDALRAAMAPFGREAQVRVVWDPPWTPDKMASPIGYRRPQGTRSTPPAKRIPAAGVLRHLFSPDR